MTLALRRRLTVLLFDIGNHLETIIGLIISLITFAVGYGMMKAKVDAQGKAIDEEKRERTELENRFDIHRADRSIHPTIHHLEQRLERIEDKLDRALSK